MSAADRTDADRLAAIEAELTEVREIVTQLHGALESAGTALLAALTGSQS